MPGTAVLKGFNSSPDKLGIEIYRCSLDGASTTVVITPTNIKWIDFVTVMPMDAASCAAGIPFLTTFTPGASSVTITGANTTEFLVKIEGKIA